MTATAQLNTALDREIWKMRNNAEAMQKMLEAAKLIRLMYVNPTALADFEAEQEQKAEAEAERQFRSLRGCWADDPEDAERMETAIREAREQDVVPLPATMASPWLPTT
jgi:hypothetical protein